MKNNELEVKSFIEGFVSEKGRIPSLDELYQSGLITHSLTKMYGGYRNLIEHLGFEYKRKCSYGVFYNKTNQEVSDIFNGFYQHYLPTRDEVESDYKKGIFPFGKDIIIYNFGGYRNFLKICGRKRESVVEKKTPRKCYTKDEIYNILKIALKDKTEFNSKQISEMYNSGEIPFGSGVIQKHFGGVLKMLNEIGRSDLMNINRHDFYTKIEMIDIFTNVYRNKAQPPLQLEVREDYNQNIIPFNVSDIVVKFKAYSKFLSEAGYTFNKGKYSQKYVSSDGTICDSKKELLIDEFLNSNNIKHQHHVKYSDLIPDVKKWNKSDFLLHDNTIVEYFGLYGVKKYNEKVKKKLAILEENNMKYIAIYPKDITRLDVIFKDYIKEVS
jgi:hypothetical protein